MPRPEPAAGSPAGESPAVLCNDLLAFVETIPIIVWRADAHGSTDFFNAAWFDYTGLSPEHSYGRAWTAAIHPDDFPRAQAAWAAAFAGGQPYSDEHRLLRRDGVYRWFLVYGQPLLDPLGAAIAWYGTCTDIEAQKSAAEALAGAKMRAEFLAHADTIFERSFATPHVITELARHAIVEFATFCFYDGIDDDGNLVRRAAVHRDPKWQLHFEAAPTSTSPWRIARIPLALIEDGEARLTVRIDDNWVRAAALDAEQEAWIRSLGINSTIAVPLVARGRRFGVMTFARTGTMDPFNAEDLETATELGRRAGAILEHARLYALTRDNEQRAAAIADAVPQIFWTARADGWIDWFNRRWYEYTGHQPADSEGWGWQSAHHPRDLPEVMLRWGESIASGRPFEMSYRLRGTDGAFRWFLTRVVPQQEEGGGIVRWYGATTNVDAERRATLQLAFFAELGERLSSLTTLEATLDAVVESLVPNFADWAIVELRDEARPYVAAAEHRSPDQRAALRKLIGRRSGDCAMLAVGTEALKTGRTSIAYGERPGMHPPATAYTSAVAVPLVVDGDIRGVFTLAMIDDAGAFSDADLPFVQEVARRIAPAFAKAEIYDRERRIAETFQGAVLPRRLPAIPGLRFDALYEPGRAEALVGGDWFDAFRIGDGRVVVTIGDVVGNGLDAATAMAEVRQSIRGAAAINPNPAILLDAADHILADHPDDRFATAWVGIVDPIDFSVRYASAGHPPPMVRDPDGWIRTLDGEGLPLGLAGSLAQRRESYTTFVEPDSLMLLFTDGLIESDRDALRGEAVLASAFAATDSRSRATAHALRDAVLGDRSAHDDVAILLIDFVERLTECRGVRARHWTFDVADAGAATAARRALATELRAGGTPEECAIIAETIVAELLGNVVRYAPGRVELVLDQTADVPVLHVIDGGHGFEHNPRLPADTYAESGRGLFIVAELARQFTISRAPSGGSHARVVLETRGALRTPSVRPDPGEREPLALT